MTQRAQAPDFDASAFRRALGQFTTGVTIITTRTPQGQVLGFTANSFNSVSLDPPLVLWSKDMHAGSLTVFRDSPRYAVNVLSQHQLELAQRFASRDASHAERVDGIVWRGGSTGAPVLSGCCAWFECFNRSRYEEGDHVIFVGEVERCGFAAFDPLIVQRGQYCRAVPHRHPMPT